MSLIDQAFQNWWRDEGSAMRPNPGEDAEEHAKRVAQIAWANGAYVSEGQSATANQRIAELESAYLEQVEMTIHMRDSRCELCRLHDAVRKRFELESA